jgi:hypothetical protein
MKRLLIGWLYIGLLGVGAFVSQATAQQTAKTDDFDNIRKSVWKHFESKENFETNDLIVREDIETLPKKLAAAGLTLKKPEDMFNRLLSKNDFLYVELNSKNGRQFMRHIAEMPLGYDRLDRLSQLPLGKQTVRDLIRGPDGQKMIEYMTTTSGGIELGKQLSNSPKGAGFNDPTGRIYTVQNLLDYLKEQFEAQKTPAASH